MSYTSNPIAEKMGNFVISFPLKKIYIYFRLVLTLHFQVRCPVCGKKYKSKVCLTKHLWEHTVYWPQFKGIKNHERVLCIQTALILTK